MTHLSEKSSIFRQKTLKNKEKPPKFTKINYIFPCFLPFTFAFCSYALCPLMPYDFAPTVSCILFSEFFSQKRSLLKTKIKYFQNFYLLITH